MPLVSVIIPAYNQGQYLGDAIQSVLNQTFPDFEAIIIDDGSMDNTWEVVDNLYDPRIHYIFQKNRGLSAARNTGIQNASGSMLTFLDSDDLFTPDKLTVLVDELRKDPHIGFVAGQTIRIDEDGRPLAASGTIRLLDDSANLLQHNPLHVGSVLIRRVWIEQVGYFDESLRACEDWDMWLRLAKAGCRMVSIERTVSLYRVHRSQMTREVERMRKATFAVLDKTFRDPCLPESWKALRDKAYSRAYLRTAGSALRAALFSDFMANLSEAVRLDPELLSNDAQPLARRFSALSDDPRIIDKLGYLESLYENLPKDLRILKKRKHRDLSQAAMRIAYQAHGQGDRVAARQAVSQALRYQPQWIFNRGAISIFVRSWLNSSIGRRE